ncbi:MAG: hypothetical protein WCS99_07200 [Limisphaerales bacterium]
MQSVTRVYMDGQPVSLPEGVRSLSGIRAFLTGEALRRKRMLCGLSLDGWPVDTSTTMAPGLSARVIASRTMRFNELPVHLIQLAREQTFNLRRRLEQTGLRMAINSAGPARQLWWDMVPELHELVVTLSLVSRVQGGGEESPSARALGVMLGRMEEELAQPHEGVEISELVEDELRRWIEAVELELSPVHEPSTQQ